MTVQGVGSKKYKLMIRQNKLDLKPKCLKQISASSEPNHTDSDIFACSEEKISISLALTLQVNDEWMPEATNLLLRQKPARQSHL